MYHTPDYIVEIARKLRVNMTDCEKILWGHIRSKKLGVKFLRQNPMYVLTEDTGLHRFIIPDFYCKEKLLILEIDGWVHDIPEVLELDRHKEKLVNNLWVRVLRIKNQDIYNNISQVIANIQSYL